MARKITHEEIDDVLGYSPDEISAIMNGLATPSVARMVKTIMILVGGTKGIMTEEITEIPKPCDCETCTVLNSWFAHIEHFIASDAEKEAQSRAQGPSGVKAFIIKISPAGPSGPLNDRRN